MLGSLILMLILFISTTICVDINTDNCKNPFFLKYLVFITLFAGQEQFFVLTLCTIAFLNGKSATETIEKHCTEICFFC